MPAADFAAARTRLAERRQRRDAIAREAASAQRAARDIQLARLPFPLSRLGNASLSFWDVIKGRDGSGPSFRVGQVDAELLDEELLELLKAQVGEGLKYFGGHLHDEYSPEVLLFLRSILFKLTIWDHNASYGASLQGLHYTDARSKSLSHIPPKKWQKGLYGLFTVGGRYAWSKWEQYLLSSTEDYTREQSPRLRRLNRLTTALSTTHSFAALASFLVFLMNGRFRTILDRVLRLRLTPTTHATSREVSFEYLNRQLVWHAFTEFLLFLLPLIGINRWRRILHRSWRQAKAFFLHSVLGRSGAGEAADDDVKSGELGFLPTRTCAICYQDQNPLAAAGGVSEAEILASGGGGVVGSAATDITNPYEAIPCGDVYCYVCLAQRIDAEEGDGWTCLRCGEVVKECRPWNGDVLEEQEKTSNSEGKTVGFANDEGSVELKGVEPMPEEDEKPSVSGVTSIAASEVGVGQDVRRDLVGSDHWGGIGSSAVVVDGFDAEQSEDTYDDTEDSDSSEDTMGYR